MTDAAVISPAALPDLSNKGRAGIFATLFFLICVSAVGSCVWAAGATLGMFLGPVALYCIFLPQTTSVLGRARDRWGVWLLASLATGSVWLVALPDMPGINARQVGQALIIISAFNLMLIAATDAVLWSGIRPTSGSAWVTLLGLGWLSWPTWLSVHLSGAAGESVANALAWAHPVSAMCAALYLEWDHYPLMYSMLSTLNQDLPYRLPPSIWPAVLVQGIPALVILTLHPLLARLSLSQRRDSARRTSIEK